CHSPLSSIIVLNLKKKHSSLSHRIIHTLTRSLSHLPLPTKFKFQNTKFSQIHSQRNQMWFVLSGLKKPVTLIKSVTIDRKRRLGLWINSKHEATISLGLKFVNHPKIY
ncbi:hypothetical protein GIB67_015542, partial [Kingdonia uniflora]